jgi:hypothetical protein
MHLHVLPVFVFDLLCLTPLSSIFQLYRGDQMFKVMEFNVTFNNISVLSWRSVLLVEK